jgi:hypothetical protein
MEWNKETMKNVILKKKGLKEINSNELQRG